MGGGLPFFYCAQYLTVCLKTRVPRVGGAYFTVEEAAKKLQSFEFQTKTWLAGWICVGVKSIAQD